MNPANSVLTRPAPADTAAVQAVLSWLEDPVAAAFPYEAVLAVFLSTGKHFVPPALLETLDGVRSALPSLPSSPAVAPLRAFLHSALDKWDGRYDYTTYLALDSLPLPKATGPQPEVARSHRDRLVVQLAADLLEFELRVADDRLHLLPELRPPLATTVKRCRLAARVATPALLREWPPRERPAQESPPRGSVPRVGAPDPVQAARELSAAVLPPLRAHERRALQLSMLPVYVAHDEYMFIRVLQMFETTFALLASQVRVATAALDRADVGSAVEALDVAATALRESAPLFSLLATMQVEAFHTFRTYTEGASAIQSRNYKVMESLCRRPDPDRLDSSAYLSVPEVRERVVRGDRSLDEVVAASLERLEPAGAARLTASMRRFSAGLLRWRQTHYRLAVRMLGEMSGTGRTEGVPYLASVRRIPVFRSVSNDPVEECRDDD